ncbi:MAG: efflux transporter periplasmic adaptor subunit [Deltaproteobacteria bacterium RBG_19FT_COMBO_60_16]|nr:MAG: efflux transporter periplasmic adaptor subunit [Deltaproteobacteria bacterium RBG_16_64_85]OGP99695.1 MAG: efflux transporter periplasmic adaptor subunit [Deltaproteobacteria bacterium RBG_19FT_COMBO_60_16]
MKRILIAALVVAVLGAAGYFYFAGSNGKAPPYRTVKVEKGEISDTVSATGNINAVTTVQVGSQVSGTIQQIYADFNSRVRKGEVIAKIDPQIFEASVVQARGSVANATAVVEKAKIVTADALRTLRRNQELIKDGYVAQADVDAAETAYDSAASQQKSAEAQLDQTRGALSVAETNLRYTTIVSPVDGIVISRNVDVGQTVAASFQTPTLFTIAQDLTKMQIDTNVDESDIGRTKAGQEATFTVDAYPGKSFAGTVIQVRNSPIVTQNVVTYDVVIQVDNKDLSLKPGMTANVSIRIRDFKDVLKIPNAALRYRPSTEKKKTEGEKEPAGARVYVVGKDGKPEAVRVKTGTSDGTFTQLVDGNLKAGDALIVAEIRKNQGATGGGSPPGMGGFR